MDKEDELAIFRLSWRIALIERLALRTALVEPLSAGKLSLEQSRDALKDWLDSNGAEADFAYGQALRDPALTSLHADEVREVIARMKTVVDRLSSAMTTRR